jgi:hypothetical protein
MAMTLGRFDDGEGHLRRAVHPGSTDAVVG